MNTMNQLGLSMENLYYIFGALLSRIILIENQKDEKIIELNLDFSHYLLYKFCNPSLVDHDWVDMLALLKLDSYEEYESYLKKTMEKSIKKYGKTIDIRIKGLQGSQLKKMKSADMIRINNLEANINENKQHTILAIPDNGWN